MKRNWKILLVMLLGIACSVLLTVGVGAENQGVNAGQCGDNLTWTLYDDGLFEITGTGPMWDYDDSSNPAPWSDYSWIWKIKSLKVNDGVETIGSYAFAGCYAIDGNLVLPNSTKSIGDSAFSSCTGIKGILILPDSVETIGCSAFSDCWNLIGNLSIPDSVRVIGQEAFYHCYNLSSVSIGTGITTIQDSAFQKCSDIRNVYFYGSAPVSFGSDVFNGTVNIYYLNGQTGWSTPEWNGYPCTSWDDIPGRGDPNRIVETGFCGDNLIWTLYGNGRLDISGEGEMRDFGYFSWNEDSTPPWKKYSDLTTSLYLSDRIVSIGDTAFWGMVNISNDLVLPKNLVRIGSNAFSDCKSMTGKIELSETITEIGDSAFSYCTSLTGDLVIPDSITELPRNAFYMCNGLNGHLSLSNHLTSIPASAFWGCGFTGDLVIPEGVTEIGQGAFSGCKFDGTLVLPESLVTIYDNAFSNCLQLQPKLIIPKNVKSIGNSAFYGFGGYRNLTFVYFESDAPECKNSFEGEEPRWDSLFGGTSDYFTIFYLNGKKGWETPEWNGYACYPVDSYDAIKPPTVGEGKCGDNLYWALYPNGILAITGKGKMWDFRSSYIGDETLDLNVPEVPWRDYKDKISDITFENGITHIGAEAFNSCYYILKSPDFPESIISIGDRAFAGCSNISGDLVLPNHLQKIGMEAFRSCRGLQGELFIPESVQSIGDYAFSYCTGLTGDLVISDSVQSIGDNAFSYCTGLTGVVLSDHLESIGYYAFGSCSGLTGDLVIPDSVRFIGSSAFYQCPNIENVYFTGDVPMISDIDESDYSEYNYRSLFACWDQERDITIYYKNGNAGFTTPTWAEYKCYPTDHIDQAGHEPMIPATDIGFEEAVITLTVGETKRLSATLTPADSTDIYLTWITSEESIVTVEDGLITGVDVGEARITVVTSHGGHAALCRVKVILKPSQHAPFSESQLIQPKTSSNINDQNYGDWTGPVNSYLFENRDGGITRVENIDGKIVVEDYSDAFVAQSSRSISMELPLWGGFYSGTRFNFFVFGQQNSQESDSVEVVRVVKYSKDWKRLGSASLYGANTVTPFDFGSVRFAEAEGMLYVRTCHVMYKTGDGVNHQASLSFMVHESDMQITDTAYDISWRTTGYVSHSMNQFIVVDPEYRLVALDHGDAYPRSIVLMRCDKMLAGDSYYGGSTEGGDVLWFPGEIGKNHTGASVGGFAATSSGYITAYNFDGKANWEKRDIYLAFTDKDTFETSSTKLTTGKDTSTPVLAARDEDGGYILWNDKTSGDNYGKTVYYASYDNGGNVSKIKSAPAELSDCQPILYNGKMVWYVTNHSRPVFYTLDESGLEKVVPKLRGDMDANGTVDSSDAIYLLRHTMNKSRYPINQDGDVNGDKKVDSNDAIHLLRHTMNSSRYPLS